MLFDADVLIWHQRRNLEASRAIESADLRAFSVVSYMEVMQGARDRQDARDIRAMLSDFDFEVLPLSESIGRRASIYVEEHALAVRIGVLDALVAATAVEHGLVLCTGNVRHYRMITDLEICAFRP